MVVCPIGSGVLPDAPEVVARLLVGVDVDRGVDLERWGGRLQDRLLFINNSTESQAVFPEAYIVHLPCQLANSLVSQNIFRKSLSFRWY